jgi:murein DD-endopeptidase MepM/ murein hydrolase activator NlpD
VRIGDFVTAGQILGTMGSTGNSSGAHAHVGVFTMKNYKVKTVPAGYYKTTFSNNESISYNAITYYSAEKFIATKGASIK